MSDAVEGRSDAEAPTVVVDEEGQLSIWTVDFGEKHSGRHAGFGGDDDVFGFHAGFGMKWWERIRERQSLEPTIFEYFET